MVSTNHLESLRQYHHPRKGGHKITFFEWSTNWQIILAQFLTYHLAAHTGYIFWHSILAFYLTFYSDILFWHSMWHLFWHPIWHPFWHLFWHPIWHPFWHLWHSLWHGYCRTSTASARSQWGVPTSVEVQQPEKEEKAGGMHLWYNLETLTWQVGNNIDLKPPTMYPLHFMYMLLVYLHMSVCLLFSAWTDGISHVPTFLMVFQDEYACHGQNMVFEVWSSIP